IPSPPDIRADGGSCVAGAAKNITGRARLLVVPLGPRFRSVIPRNFSSGESALQLLLIENRAFLAGSRPLGTMREEALSARVNSCPSQNLRGCGSWVGGGGKNITGRARLSVVPLRPHFRSVIPRNFSSEESALQLLLIENRAFLAGSRPLGDYERRSSIGTSKLVPFPKSARMRVLFLRRRRGTLQEGHDF